MKRYKTNVRKLAAIMNGLQLSLLGVLFFLIAAFPVFCTVADQGPQPLNVLIFSGQNNHDWRSTTPVLRKMYEECDRFAVVDVTDEPGICDAATFAKYDVIVSNWTEYPDTKRTWPEQTEKAFMDFVKSGGGFVVFHASSCSFQQWPEFQNIVGITWLADHTAHGAYHSYKVTIEDKEHPVTRGMDDFYHTDELYHNMVTLAKPDMKVLCKAFSAKDKAGTDKFEPVLVSTKLGKGRGLNLVLGHDAAAMQNIGYQTLMLRGAEWAATGEVTTVIPDFWPVTAGAEAVLRNDFDTVLDAALGYQHGQDRKPLAAIERLVRYATSADCEPTCSAIADKLAAKMADILASKATVDCKKFLCKQLAIIGTREQIPVLESLLTDELLSFMARYALEGIGGAEADKALRGALGKVEGRMKVGVVNSLGNRGDSKAIGQLAALLNDSDAELAEAATVAMGKIGGNKAAKALSVALLKTSGQLRLKVADAYLMCADTFLAAGKSRPARKIYKQMYKSKESLNTRLAVLRGLVTSGGNKGIGLLVDVLESDEQKIQQMAIRLISQLPQETDIKAVTKQLPKLPIPVQVMLLNALAERGDKTTLTTVVRAANSKDSSVQIAALKAIGKLGDASSTKLLIERMAGSEAERKAARNSLDILIGAKVNEAIVEQLKDAKPEVKVELIRSLAERNAIETTTVLMKTAEDTNNNVRSESWKALRELGQKNDLPNLIELLVSADSGQRKEAEKTVVAILQMIPPGNNRAEVVLRKMDSVTEVQARCSLLRVLGTIGDDSTLPNLRQAVRNDNPDIRDTAIRALSSWPTTLVIDDLLKLAGSEQKEVHRILALRGFVRLLDKVQGRSDEEMAKLLGEALKVASRTDGKKALFGALSHHKSLATMQLAQVYLKDSNLVNEASTAVINIAEAIKGSHSKEVKLAMQQVLANSKEVETNDKANTILLEVSKALDLPAEAAPGGKQGVSRPPVSKKPSYAQIMEHNGTPTLFLNDQPVNYSGTWVFGPSNPNWGADCTISLLASNTDTHIYAFEAGTGGPAPQWCGPGSGYSGDFDFSKVKPTFERIIDVDPHAFFHLRVHLEIISEWWCKAYPEECEVTSLGRQPRQSYASKVWRTQAIDFLSAFISHIKSIGMLNRVIAFQVGGGHTGEWVKRRSSMAAPCGDYSEPMRQHFRAYLSKKYNNDISALRNAWNNPEIAFDTVEVPSAREQLHAKNFIFRDPSSERNVIDYFQCLAELCSDVIIDYCKTVKEETNGKCLAGAFYGYLMELSWNSGFFAEWPDRWSESDYSTTQRSGHLGLDKIFDSPYIDFLVSPYSYGFRGIGGESPSMIPVESARLHGKFIIVEDDVRLHGDTYHARYGQAKNLQESITILKRNFNQYVTHGQGYWRTATDNKKLYPVLKQLNEVGTFALQTDRTPIAEIAVLLDDESFYFETVKNNLDVPLIFRQKLEGLVRFGAIFNTYLLDDFIKGRVQPHKLYIFLNSFRIDSARREKLKSELQRDGRIAVWLYAPGYIKDDLSMENMRDLTGFKFAMSRQPWGASMHIVNFNHPITSGILQDLFWGTNNLLSPVFYLEDPDALELGQVVHAQGRCVPGMGVKVFREWTSIFVSAPNIPAPVLRGLARFAKVHLYNEEGDVLNATKHLLGVHTVSGGKRTFKLPNKVQEVYDLYNNKSIASNTDQFQVILLPKSTSLYYTGDTSLLAKLKDCK